MSTAGLPGARLHLVAPLMAPLVEKHDDDFAIMPEPSEFILRDLPDEPMDVDPAASPSPLSAETRGLPFPGKLVDGVHEVVCYDLHNLPRAGLRDLCDAYHLGMTGNKATLIERLKKFSAARKEWDSFPSGARSKKSGPRDGGVTKNAKDTSKTIEKQSTRQKALPISGAANGADSKTQQCLPTERSKDMHTDEEKALLAWAKRFVELNPYIPEHEQSKQSKTPPHVCRDSDATAHVHGETSDSPSSSIVGPLTATQIREYIIEQLKQIEADIAALVTAIASGNGTSVTPSPTAIITPGIVPAHGVPGTVDTATSTSGPPPSTATSPQATAFREQSPTFATASTSEPQGYIKLGNGKVLCFPKQSVPDPPSISFTKDLPKLMRMWDDSSPEWSPSEAVLHVEGEPIALKHWQDLYRHGKFGQWAGVKKSWSNWRDIAVSWKELTENGFWNKFSVDHQPMTYTAICAALKNERMADNRRLTELAKDKYGDGFGSAFKYRRGSEYIVRNKLSAIARHYRGLRVSD